MNTTKQQQQNNVAKDTDNRWIRGEDEEVIDSVRVKG